MTCGLMLMSVLVGRAQQADEGALQTKPFAARSEAAGNTMFTEMQPELTGIVTENRYDDPAMWHERYAEFTTGSIGTGVAIGDYDQDGRPDIFVVSKTESCRLFRNLGAWKFEDVTETAGVGDAGPMAKIWKQGASFVDVNNDGWLDLYVCRFDAPNLLYVNQGDGTFREEGLRRGLAVDDASVMGAFCDYDRDGWLDVLVQTNRPEAIGTRREQQNYLFRNRGDGTFEDVTERAGIGGRGQGHSATWWDYDEDGWPDLHVANDFTPADKLYRNNGDGTFTDRINEAMPHHPFSSMGADLGDVNNDGRIDFFVGDMAATTHQKDQRTGANARSLIVEPAAGAGGAPFFMRNALYLNTGTSRLLEAACLAGLAATDWTWSVRFEDLDNDGRLDLHVTNGMHREPHNADLMARIAAAQSIPDKIRIERASPVLNEQNLTYRNRGDLLFEEVGTEWGLAEKGVSFGAGFGDLDGDGDLDLVYTNYRKGVTVLRNDSSSGNRLVVELRGVRSNRFGVGATVRIETDAGPQIRQLVLARGYLSASEPVVHFGLGDETRVRSLVVTWPSGIEQRFPDVAANQRVTITEQESVANAPALDSHRRRPHFAEVSAAMNLSWKVAEPAGAGGSEQPLMPMRQSGRGPAIAASDLNGDGRDDIVLSGSAANSPRVLWAQGEGKFAASELSDVTFDAKSVAGPVVLVDANGDGATDILFTKAGAGHPAEAAEYQPILLHNDGRGGFRPAPAAAVPMLRSSIGAAAAADFDRSGGMDVFLGARVLPGGYPRPPRSALLAHREGVWRDVTEQVAPELADVGMVTSALWSDADGDGWLDLLVSLEWGGVKLFRNREGKRFEDASERAGFASAGTGWWTALAAADFNRDGHMDYVAGNVGLNTPYRADPQHPVLLFAGDFDGRAGEELVEAYYEGETMYPRRSRRELTAVIPGLLKRFPRNDAFARATLVDVLGEDKIAAARRFAATELRSGVFLSGPGGRRRFEPLPRLSQVAPAQGLAAGDFDGDGHADLYLLHNSYAPVAAIGRFDGGLSQFLRGDGEGNFTEVPLGESGLIVPGDAEGLAVLDFDGDGWPDFFASRHGQATLAFRNRAREGRNALEIRLRGRVGNATAIGARAVLHLADGTTQTAEVHSASGYYSQSAPGCHFGWTDSNPPRQVHVRWPSGEVTRHAIEPKVGRVLLAHGK